MTEIELQHYLAVGAILFCIGLIGFLCRRNLIVMFLCTELMFQGVAINLIAFGRLSLEFAWPEFVGSGVCDFRSRDRGGRGQPGFGIGDPVIPPEEHVRC